MKITLILTKKDEANYPAEVATTSWNHFGYLRARSERVTGCGPQRVPLLAQQTESVPGQLHRAEMIKAFIYLV